jgi:hypothetical protein
MSREISNIAYKIQNRGDEFEVNLAATWGRQERGDIIVNSIYYDISPLPWLSQDILNFWHFFSVV